MPIFHFYQKCLGDSSWGKMGQVVMLTKDDKLQNRLIARVLELTTGAACATIFQI